MKLIISLVVCFLMLTGCANRGSPIVVPCSPPVVYLQDVAEPTLDGQTNKDLARYVLELKEALKRSNLDKYYLREWAEMGND